MNKITTLLYILCAFMLPTACFGQSFIQLSSGTQSGVMAEVGSMPSNSFASVNRTRGTRQITKQAGSTNVSTSVSYGGSYSASPLSRKKATTAAALSGGALGCTTAMVGGHNAPSTTYDAPSAGGAASISNISKAARPDSGNTGNVPVGDAAIVMMLMAVLYTLLRIVRVRKARAQSL